jgi:hypothetical protein
MHDFRLKPLFVGSSESEIENKWYCLELSLLEIKKTLKLIKG